MTPRFWLCADGRWSGMGGIGRFSHEVLKRLPEAHVLRGGPGPAHPLGSVWSSWWVRRFKPKVFFTPGYNPPLSSHAPALCVIHDLIHLRFPGESTQVKRFYYDRVIAPAIRRTGRVLTVSEFSRQEIAEWLRTQAETVVVTPNAIGPEFGPSGARSDFGFPYALYVGNQKKHKNVMRLLEAMSLLKHAPDLHLMMTGSASRDVHAAIDRLGLSAKVRFAGRVEDYALASLYRGAELVVLPSLYEGFGLPVLEAMACGTPVAAADRTSIPEIAGGAALLFNPERAAEIAAAIDRVATDTSLRQQLRQKGLERARMFSWDTTAGRVRAIIDELRGS